MSVDDTLAEILAETERRKVIWEKIQNIAYKAVEAVQKQANKRGVTGKEWVNSDFWGNVCVLAFDGKDEPKKSDRALCVLISPSGKVGWSQGEEDENLVHEGYPNVRDEKGLGNWNCLINGQFIGPIANYSPLSDEELQKRSMGVIWRYVEGRFPSLKLSVRSITSITPL